MPAKAKQKPGPKTTNRTQREEHIETVGRMRLRGHTQHEIAKLLGISQPMVVYNEKICRQRMKARLERDQDTNIDEKRLQYEDVRREAWAAWFRSMEDADKLVEEYAVSREKVRGGKAKVSEELVNKIVTKEGRLPNNAYLATIMQTLQAERELLGLDEARKVEHTVHVFDWSPLMAKPKIVDPVEIAVKVLDETQAKESVDGTKEAQGAGHVQ